MISSYLAAQAQRRPILSLDDRECGLTNISRAKFPVVLHERFQNLIYVEGLERQAYIEGCESSQIPEQSRKTTSAGVLDRGCPNVLELFRLEILCENGLFRLKSQHLERQAQELCRLLVPIYTSH